MLTLDVTLFGATRTVEVKVVAPHLAYADADLAFQVGNGTAVYHRQLRLWPLAGLSEKNAAGMRSQQGRVFVGSDGAEYAVDLTDNFYRGRGRAARAFGWASDYPATAR